VFILGKILDHIVRDIINRLHLDGLNRFFGLLLGLIEGVTLIVLILVVLQLQPLFDPLPLLSHSIFARFFLPLTKLVYNQILL
jgi:membrane protein required for colicin V production